MQSLQSQPELKAVAQPRRHRCHKVLRPDTKAFFASPKARNRFFSVMPPEITRWEWLWHRANRHRFEPWVETLLVTISNLSSRFGWTFCHQKFLAREFGKSERWLGEILGRLTAIGVVETDRRADGNHYRLNPGFEGLKNFAQKPGSVGSSAGSSGQKSLKPTATPLKQMSSGPGAKSDMVSMTCYDNTEPPHTRAQAQERAHEEEPTPAIGDAANPEWGQRMEIAEQILAACNQLFELKLRTVAIHHPKPFVTTLAQKPLAELQADLDGHLSRIAEHQRKRAAQPGPGGTASVPLTEAEIKWQKLPEPEQAHWHDLACAEMEHNGTYDQIRKEFGP
ncbi:MAG: hypothetical protein K1Y36_24430, partial [Blastocatellia bacterium]|nr:hypothetical protein [Blastocatellia bacterium]